MHFSVGIDVSKGKSTVCVLAETGEVVRTPYGITHTKKNLETLVTQITGYGANEDVRVILEATGAYSVPVQQYLQSKGIFVCCVNPLIMKEFIKADNNFRRVKTDRSDAVHIASYGLKRWYSLKETITCSEDEGIYRQMRELGRNYHSIQKPCTQLIQHLDHIIDQVMPGIKKEFGGYNSVTGKDPLTDFVKVFWHYDYITSMGPKKFNERFRKWAKEKGYHPRKDKSGKVYQLAREGIPTLECNANTKLQVTQAAEAVLGIHKALYQILTQLRDIAITRPEYSVIRAMPGVGDTLAPLLVAEVGDPRKYHSGAALVAYTGIDVPPEESGQFKANNKKITRKGSRYLRKLGYLVIDSLKTIKPEKDTAVYDCLMKKRQQGKPYKVAVVAAMNKFYRIYYARAMEAYSS